MASYDWHEFENRNLFERFPEWANGFNEWRNFMENFPREEFSFNEQIQLPTCPRVFVSHKKEDDQIARRIAWLAVQEKFEFWLDVFDPPLQAFLSQKGLYTPLEEARLTAAIIEMGLINCTHVIAAITKQSRPSRWIPYEYGRVKDNKTLVGPTASWLPKSEMGNLPEYLHLGNLSHTEQDLRNWLANEFSNYPDSEFCKGEDKKIEEPDINLDEVF